LYKAFYAPANLTEWYNFNGTGGPYERPGAGDPARRTAAQPQFLLHEPALLQNGWNDDLFPVSESVDYYNKVRSVYPTAPVKRAAVTASNLPWSQSLGKAALLML
jgi:hypothetical protein